MKTEVRYNGSLQVLLTQADTVETLILAEMLERAAKGVPVKLEQTADGVSVSVER